MNEHMSFNSNCKRSLVLRVIDYKGLLALKSLTLGLSGHSQKAFGEISLQKSNPMLGARPGVENPRDSVQFLNNLSIGLSHLIQRLSID